MTPEGRQIFLERKLNFLKGQSSRVRHFAERSLASLASSEVSARSRNEVVEQSKLLAEDYIYNRLSVMLHIQQERHLEQIVGGGPHVFEHQTSTSSDTCSDTTDMLSESTDNLTPPSSGHVTTENEDAFFKKSISRLFSRYPTPSAGHEVFIQSSPDKIGLARFEKWRNEISDASSEIIDLGHKLENAYPWLYDNVSAQMKMPLRSEVAVTRAMTSIGDFMFKNNFVTWYRIVALFAVAGAVALEVVDNRRGDLIGPLVQTFSQIIDRHVALWVCKQGGWLAIIPDYEPTERKYQELLKFLGILVGFCIAVFFPMSYFGYT